MEGAPTPSWRSSSCPTTKGKGRDTGPDTDTGGRDTEALLYAASQLAPQEGTSELRPAGCACARRGGGGRGPRHKVRLISQQ